MHVLYGFLRKNKIMIIIVVVVFIYYITSFGIGAHCLLRLECTFV